MTVNMGDAHRENCNAKLLTLVLGLEEDNSCTTGGSFEAGKAVQSVKVQNKKSGFVV